MTNAVPHTEAAVPVASSPAEVGYSSVYGQRRARLSSAPLSCKVANPVSTIQREAPAAATAGALAQRPSFRVCVREARVAVRLTRSRDAISRQTHFRPAA